MKHIHLIALAALLAAPAMAGTTRSAKARTEFVKQQACPATALNRLPCKGFVLDHKEALDCGGKDEAANIQWLTVAAAKAKDRYERDGPNCKHRTNAK